MRAYPTSAPFHNRAVAVLAAAALAGPAAAQYESGTTTPAATFDTAADAEFGDPHEGLAALVREHPPRRAGPQHFCVVGYRGRDGHRNAYIVWREGHRQVLWEGWSDPLNRVSSIARSRRDLDMTTDVVPDGTFNSSTYMIFRSEQLQVERDCARAGRKYVVRWP